MWGPQRRSFNAALPIAPEPRRELGPLDPEELARLTDVVRRLLVVLDYPQPGPRSMLLSSLLGRLALHPGPTFEKGYPHGTPGVRESG